MGTIDQTRQNTKGRGITFISPAKWLMNPTWVTTQLKVRSYQTIFNHTTGAGMGFLHKVKNSDDSSVKPYETRIFTDFLLKFFV